MSFSPQQPRRPPRRPERTPSTDYVFSPSSPAAFTQSPRPGASPAYSRPVYSPAFSPEPRQSRASPAFSPSPRPVPSPAPYSPISSPRQTPQPRFPFIDEESTPRSQPSPRPRPPPQEWINPEPLPAPSPRSAYREASPARHRGNAHGGPPLRQISSPKSVINCPPSPSVYSSSQGHARVSSHDASVASVPYGSSYGSNYDPYDASMESTTTLVVHAQPHEKMSDVPLSPDPRASPPVASPPPAVASKSRFSTVTEVGVSDDSSPATPPKRSWVHTAQWILIPSLTVTTAVVAIVIGHSLGLYGGLKLGGSIDTSSNAHPTWPSNLNLLPSWLLLGVGAASCLTTLVVWGFSLRRRFMKPVGWLEGFRIGAGVFFVAAWAAVCAIFKVFEQHKGDESLGYWACAHQGEDIMGVHDYWRTCTEQNVGFALGIASAAIELLLMVCFFVRRSQKGDDVVGEKMKA
ncbi:hypothetical protein IWZ01DRAFT_247767 [Phyllosticta capitalensis]